MAWLIAVLILTIAGLTLHRALYPSRGNAFPLRSPSDPLGAPREAIFQPLAAEIKQRAGIIAVSLNEAFKEDDQGQGSLAAGMLSLAEAEWSRLAEELLSVHDLMLKYLPLLRYAVPLRSAVIRQCRSAAMQELARAHEELEQFVYRPRFRFHIHLSALRSAGRTLTDEFFRFASEARQAPVLRLRWKLLDLFFYDFDLIAKDSLLALRMILAALPDELLPEFACDLQMAPGREVKDPVLAPRQ